MARSKAGVETPDDLFLNLAEQVKLPFVQIIHAAELMEEVRDPELAEVSRKSIALSARAALNLIDGYLLSVQLQRQHQLELEPVSVSSVLYDTAAALHDYAKSYDCKLELQVAGRYAPVMAHRAAIQAALMSLGLSFIEAIARSGEKPVVHLAARRGVGGITAGVFSDQPGISGAMLKQAKVLRGRVHQPLQQFDSGTGSGIFIADALFTQINASMRVARLQGLQGLAATFAPSRQLNLV